MATLNSLTDDVMGWLDRRDIQPSIPGWIRMCEVDQKETLRARCMIKRAYQNIDANFIELPPRWLEFEGVYDAVTGLPLSLEDNWTGPAINLGSPVTGYRIVGDCIEFLPHPTIPDPPDPNWKPAQAYVVWYDQPPYLVEPQDSNRVLEELYSVYLFGALKYGAMFELDDARAAQMTTAYDEAITKANRWKVMSDYSGAPLRARQPVAF